jgi:hypothetical protein
MIEHADISSHAITCDEAWLYCATLEHNGKYDWRMPLYSERIESSVMLAMLATWDLGDYLTMISDRVSLYNMPWYAPSWGQIHRYQVIPVRDIL